MAQKKEGPIVNNETGSLKVKEKKQEPTNNETKGNVTKVKATMKKPTEVIEQTVTKVNLNEDLKPKENETKENNADNSGVAAESKDAKPTQEQEKVQQETQAQETPVLEEITEDETTDVEEKVKEVVTKTETTVEVLPENIQKLVDFMKETGGDMNDYIKLNQDYSKLDNEDLLREYYTQTKPHLNTEEISFLMEDQFSYDEDADDEREIRRKKLALKEQVANAKTQLEENKSKYYKEIQAGSKLTNEQQKAVDFFNRYEKEEAETQKNNEQRVNKFQKETKNLFNDKFKGFEYNVGEKNFRYSVPDADKVKDNQSDINNFIGKFLDENNTIKDAKGYHKSLFTAMNPDAIAKHFYEQGQADAMKTSVEKGKNIDMNPRQAHGEVQAGGIKVKVLGDNTADFKFKIKNNK